MLYSNVLFLKVKIQLRVDDSVVFYKRIAFLKPSLLIVVIDVAIVHRNTQTGLYPHFLTGPSAP